MSLYLKYTCMKWIYHMRSFKYDWLKKIYIYTCINYNYRYMYIYTFFWFVLYARNVKIKVNQENRFLDFFFERDWEQENADFIEILSFKLPCSIICDNINWLFIFLKIGMKPCIYYTIKFSHGSPICCTAHIRSTCWLVAKWINFWLI